MKYVLDTDHLSILQRQSGAEYANIVAHYENNEDEIALCVISFHEQVLGCHTYINKSRDDAGRSAFFTSTSCGEACWRSRRLMHRTTPL